MGVAKRSQDVVPLLWEIARLRGMLLRANQVIRELPQVGGPNGIVRECLQAELKFEPCIAEEEQRRIACLNDERDY